MAGTFVLAGRFGNRWLRKWWKEKTVKQRKEEKNSSLFHKETNGGQEY